MTFMTIPAASIAGMVFSLVVSFALPIGLFVYAKKKLGAKTAPFFIGCGVFFVMVLMLEAAIHRIVFQLAGEALTGSVILYAVYGGLMAALFEETGRYIAMRFLVKPLDFPNAFMYGAGHGGVEAMLLCGVASISNIASAVMINSGTMSAQLASLDAKKAADTAAALSALWTTPQPDLLCRGRRADHCGGAPSEPVDSGVPVHPQKVPERPAQCVSVPLCHRLAVRSAQCSGICLGSGACHRTRDRRGCPNGKVCLHGRVNARKYP